ncbi:methylenetetrahydrofolate reductase [bacterium]|nr:methylenetetrahydrofolate reductase [bacterium]
MKPENTLARTLAESGFIITAEYLPQTGTDEAPVQSAAGLFDRRVTAVNVSDNPDGVVMSAIAASVVLFRSGIEPVYQVVTRDRNRIALQSDLLGAACLGIRNVLCLSGYHQTLGGCPESANVYDIDSVQLIAAVNGMRERGVLIGGTPIGGQFPVLVGGTANPFMKPLELNMIRLLKKVEAGADFIQTQAVFDVECFREWLDTARAEGIPEKACILAGVLPLVSAVQAERLRDTYTEFRIPDEIIGRLRAAGDEKAQRREGITVCAEVIQVLKNMKGLRGIHILSGGNEQAVPAVLDLAGL